MAVVLDVVPSRDDARKQVWLYPRFHVRPPSHWINDPNGLTFFNNHYHVFMQYSPSGEKWAEDISWFHVTSTDMVTWVDRGVALAPSEQYDARGVFSGSITLVNNTPIASYTCNGQDKAQRQCQATPADLDDVVLKAWTKSAANPVIRSPPVGVPADMFRDPTDAWFSGGKWWQAFAAAAPAAPPARPNASAAVALYTSTDFQSWAFSHYMYASAAQATMYECPNVFEVQPGIWALKYSLMTDRQDWYLLGTMDGEFRFTPTSEPRLLDGGGAMYASSSFAHGQRRVLWGWLPEADGEDGALARRWAGTLTLPRVVGLDTVGGERVLRLYPTPETAGLRSAKLQDSTMSLTRTRVHTFGFQTQHAEFRMSAPMPPLNAVAPCVELRVLQREDGEAFTAARVCRVGPGADGVESWRLEVDRRQSGGAGPRDVRTQPFRVDRASERVLELLVYADGSVVEAFAQRGRATVSVRVYPDAGQFHAAVVSAGYDPVGVQLQAYAYGAAFPDRDDD